MEPGSTQWFILFILLLVLYACFVLAKTALTTRRLRSPRLIREEGLRGARMLERVMKDMDKLSIAFLLGRIGWWCGTAVMVSAFAAQFAPGALPFFAVLVAYVLLVLLLCELPAQAMARRSPERMALVTAPPVFLYMLLLSPVLLPLRGFARLLQGDAPGDTAPAITEEELKTIVSTRVEEGVMRDEEQTMINNVFDFGNTRAKDVMTPRTDIVALPVAATVAEALAVFKREQFSRIPVYREDLDHIVGLLHFKDLVFAMDDVSFTMESTMREAFFSYESKLTSELFSQMRSMSSPMAVILDEYGGTAGIVTLEDMVEEIVGDIMDEYDEENDITEIVPRVEYMASGTAKIDDFNDLADTSLTSENYDSLGGYVTGLLDSIPNQGDVVTDDEHHIMFTVVGLDKNRIEKLRIVLNDAEKANEPIDKRE